MKKDQESKESEENLKRLKMDNSMTVLSINELVRFIGEYL